MGGLLVAFEGDGEWRVIPTRDLEFTKTDRGGFTSANLSVPQFVDSGSKALQAGSRVTMYDYAARPVFEGYLDLPGKSAERDGQVWKLGVLGSAAILSDKSAPYVSIESSLEGFYQRRRFGASGQADVATTPDGATATAESAVVLSVPGGTVVANGVVAAMDYDRLVASGQQLGGIAQTRLGGKADANWNAEMTVYGDDGTPAALDLFSVNLAVGPTVSASRVVGTDWTAGADVLRYKLARDGGATTVVDDTTWLAYYDIYVAARRLLATGSYAPDADHANAYVLAHEVITDAAQMLTSLLDVANADIDTSFTYHIDQLAYPDGVTLADLLADVALLEPDLTYGVFEAGSAGTHRFRVGKYDTDVRYVASTVDGWEQPGGELSLSNELTVYYIDKRGRPQHVTVTTPVPALDQWGRVRSAPQVDLGTEVGTAAAATQVGAGLLAQASTFPFAGRLTVARPILDQMTGRMVMPWEIEPGYMLQVQDILDMPPMRLTEMTYRDASMSAELTLGTPTYSTDELVAKLAKRRHRKGGKPVAAAYA
jgi:hypothetical protein